MAFIEVMARMCRKFHDHSYSTDLDIASQLTTRVFMKPYSQSRVGLFFLPKTSLQENHIGFGKIKTGHKY